MNPSMVGQRTETIRTGDLESRMVIHIVEIDFDRKEALVNISIRNSPSAEFVSLGEMWLEQGASVFIDTSVRAEMEVADD